MVIWSSQWMTNYMSNYMSITFKFDLNLSISSPQTIDIPKSWKLNSMLCLTLPHSLSILLLIFSSKYLHWLLNLACDQHRLNFCRQVFTSLSRTHFLRLTRSVSPWLNWSVRYKTGSASSGGGGGRWMSVLSLHSLSLSESRYSSLKLFIRSLRGGGSLLFRNEPAVKSTGGSYSSSAPWDAIDISITQCKPQTMNLSH